MQPILSYLQAHPAQVVQYFLLFVSVVVAALPAKTRDSSTVGFLVRVLGRLSVLEHSDAPGTLKWPGVAAAARDAVLAEATAATVVKPPTAGLLVLMLAGLALSGPIGCGGTLRQNVITASNEAARAVNAASGPVLSAYCSQSMTAIGRSGVWESGACVAGGDRAGTPATAAELVALDAVRARWRPLLGSCRTTSPASGCSPGIWDDLVAAHAALVSALDAGDASSLPARLVALLQVYGHVSELARGFGLSLPAVGGAL